jgi:hypothetical protein
LLRWFHRAERRNFFVGRNFKDFIVQNQSVFSRIQSIPLESWGATPVETAEVRRHFLHILTEQLHFGENVAFHKSAPFLRSVLLLGQRFEIPVRVFKLMDRAARLLESGSD